ncbi:synaptogyrin-4 isoform X3 [Pelodiscus sinensis]|uniref:synaptogyrin-4 isoform X3 n=1 Tax=Pelodiscus sinensis TaxID=13735 RepID=UPI000D71E152|nr:synaptogyrin-4 isoform X4 [Pelodiscus sinensis]|eukprot:XP_025039756.1 synaptogyrin-4 isoform X4 [Pelodiscus sinensis]
MRRVRSSLQELSENNVVQFLKKPQTIARILAGLFSLIIFASLVTDGYQNLTASSQLRCVLNDNGVACGYAITAGILAFLQSFLFLAFDAYDSIIISHKVKSVILSVDLTFSIVLCCSSEIKIPTSFSSSLFPGAGSVTEFPISSSSGHAYGSLASVSWPINGTGLLTTTCWEAARPAPASPLLSSLSPAGKRERHE